MAKDETSVPKTANRSITPKIDRNILVNIFVVLMCWCVDVVLMYCQVCTLILMCCVDDVDVFCMMLRNCDDGCVDVLMCWCVDVFVNFVLWYYHNCALKRQVLFVTCGNSETCERETLTL
jgi:hypothetical protein